MGEKKSWQKFSLQVWSVSGFLAGLIFMTSSGSALEQFSQLIWQILVPSIPYPHIFYLGQDMNLPSSDTDNKTRTLLFGQDCGFDYVWAWLCMDMYGYVWLIICAPVWLCLTMYDYVWLLTMYEYECTCMTKYDFVWLSSVSKWSG